MDAMPPGTFNRGFVLVSLGRYDEGFPILERTPVHAFARYFWYPLLDPIRDDPRFQQLLMKLGCTEEYKVARATLARMRREQAAKK